ncbi:hypothetical protein ACQPZP_27370 [Spirillospora sp. CA-142024]|uniref:hypothetical protein n=1 Tax=Spirillospora sp. CA-142024 TaxID=3240036 RepID=UPI003D93A528
MPTPDSRGDVGVAGSRGGATSLAVGLLRRTIRRPDLLWHLAADPASLREVFTDVSRRHLQVLLATGTPEERVVTESGHALDEHVRRHRTGERRGGGPLSGVLAVAQLLAPGVLLTCILLPHAVTSPNRWAWPAGALTVAPVLLWLGSRWGCAEAPRPSAALLTGGTSAVALTVLVLAGELLLLGYLLLGIWGTARPLMMTLRRGSRREARRLGARTPLSAVLEALARPQPGRFGISLWCVCDGGYTPGCPASSSRWRAHLDRLTDARDTAVARWEDRLLSDIVLPFVSDRSGFDGGPAPDDAAIWPTIMDPTEFCTRLRPLLTHSEREEAVIRVSALGEHAAERAGAGVAIAVANGFPGLFGAADVYLRFDLSIGSATLIPLPTGDGEAERYVVVRPAEAFAEALGPGDPVGE